MIYMLVLVLCLASCGGGSSIRKANRYAEKKLRKKRNPIELIRQQEAKLSDIPIPISSRPLIEYCMDDVNPQKINLGYQSSLAADDLQLFFNREMERHGWQMPAYAQFSGYERLLTFHKPNRVCTISLRPKTKKTDVVIFSGIRS